MEKDKSKGNDKGRKLKGKKDSEEEVSKVKVGCCKIC